jgi:hypothetical protein
MAVASRARGVVSMTLRWEVVDAATPTTPYGTVLAQWAASGRAVDPYWLLSDAMGHPALDTTARWPVMLEREQAPAGQSRFVLAWKSATDLPALIAVQPAIWRRWQLDAPRSVGADPDARLPSPQPAALEQLLRHHCVIDDGIPFAHRSLLGIDAQARVTPDTIWLWDQGSRAAGAHWSSASLPFGVALSHGAIAGLVGATSAQLDERRSYRQAQYLGDRARTPHGVGVTHLFAGRDVALPDGSRADFRTWRPAPLLAVQLPRPALADTAGAWLGFYALAALREATRVVMARAAAAERDWQLVVNLSYGSAAGPHDGSTMFERALDEWIDAVGVLSSPVQGESTAIPASRRLQVVMASGNLQGAQVHARRVVRAGSPGRFSLFVPPDHPRETYVECWLPAAADDGSDLDLAHWNIHVTPPGGATQRFAAGQAALVHEHTTLPPSGGAVFARRVAQGEQGTMFLLLLRPTRIARADRARAGTWAIDIEHGSAAHASVRAWVERSDLIDGPVRRPQQARFLADPSDPGHLPADGSLSHCAHAAHVAVAGAVRQSDGVIASYTGRGHAHGHARPQWYAAGDRGSAISGVLVPGQHAGQWARLGGTSAAAPWVARWIASGHRAQDLRATLSEPGRPPLGNFTARSA